MQAAKRDTVRLEAARSKVPFPAAGRTKENQHGLKMFLLVAVPKLNARIVSGILHQVLCSSICCGDAYGPAHRDSGILQTFTDLEMEHVAIRTGAL